MYRYLKKRHLSRYIPIVRPIIEGERELRATLSRDSNGEREGVHRGHGERDVLLDRTSLLHFQIYRQSIHLIMISVNIP